MIETALVFDDRGLVIRFHLPLGRTSTYIPDSRDLWKVMWKYREILGGVAHVHPWDGLGGPSETDVTTFAACEAGLGKRLIWPIVTFTHITFCVWMGPGRLDYGTQQGIPAFRVEGIDRLRELARNGGQPAEGE